jgi:hypothetical protein
MLRSAGAHAEQEHSELRSLHRAVTPTDAAYLGEQGTQFTCFAGTKASQGAAALTSERLASFTSTT